MRRRVLLCLTLISLSACNGDTVVKPTASPGSPTNAISDATHSALGYTSNPDFFFLPPMVGNPSGSPQWDAGTFNASLRPTVEICASSALTESTVATSPCTPVPPALAATVDATSEQYHVNWKVPTSSTIFYRITVKVGQKTLGFADVETASNASQLKNVATGDFIPLSDGRTLPIKFRIERYALCAVPGVGPCTSVSGDIAVAPLTVLTGTPDVSGISTTVGVTIPQQTGGASSTPVTVTITSCPNLNPTAIDLPTFGDCVRVTTDPQLDRLTSPATVFVCAVGVSASLFQGLTEAQEARVTLHRYDASGPNAGVTALPHATACTPGTPGGIASTGPSLRGMLASLAHGRIRHAASQAVALLAPKPLYAAMFIDLGGGGYTEFFSDFQFALPAKMEIVGGDGQAARPGASLLVAPTVKVTDLDDHPVQGARVTFAVADGGGVAVLPPLSGETMAACHTGETCAVAITDGEGLAHASWTLRGQTGPNALLARGRGIGGSDVNGPRGQSPTSEIDVILDPFQPIQTLHALPDANTHEVSVQTGSVTFSATGQLGVVIYGPTLTAPVSPYVQNEQLLASAAGLAVTVWDAATWSTKTAADFSQFNAIVFPDPVVGNNCALNPSLLATADATKSSWSPAVNGPIVIMGTDPMFHQPSQPQAVTLISNAVRFAASNPTATGLYATLSCYYFSVSSSVATPVSFLSGVGQFSVLGQAGLGQSVTIASPSHPVMATLTAPGLSNWHDSAHEAFPILSSYPAGFEALALINKPATEENLPYIIARGTPIP